MNELQKDPILAALARIEDKQDELLKNQVRMDKELQEIRKDCKKSAAIYGGLGGVIVTTGWELIRAKFGG